LQGNKFAVRLSDCDVSVLRTTDPCMPDCRLESNSCGRAMLSQN